MYIIIYIIKLQNPPLAFGVRERMGVAVVAQKKIPEPPTHVGSERGDGGGRCHLEKKTRTPRSRLKRGRGWRWPRSHLERGRGGWGSGVGGGGRGSRLERGRGWWWRPWLVFGAREGVVGII